MIQIKRTDGRKVVRYNYLSDLGLAFAAALKAKGRDFTKLDLTGSAIKNLMVDGKDLSETSFTNCFVKDVVFRECNLEGVSFADAIIQGCSFHACRINDADFSASEIESAVFKDCRMEHARMQHAKMRHVLFHECVLRGSRLSSTDLSYVEFTACDMTATDMSHAVVLSSDFTASYLADAICESSDFYNCSFHKADLCRVCFTGSKLTDTFLDTAVLERAVFTGADLFGTCLSIENPIPRYDLKYLEERGYEADSQYIYGYRTSHSIIGKYMYELREEPYEAPVFSVSRRDCHPGLYFWSRPGLPGSAHVRVKARHGEFVLLTGKARAKRLWVISEL